jgi:hypothetical protein
MREMLSLYWQRKATMLSIPAWLTGCGFTARLAHRKAASAISIKGDKLVRGALNRGLGVPKI